MVHFASSTWEAEDRTRWKGIVLKSFLGPNDLASLWNRED